MIAIVDLPAAVIIDFAVTWLLKFLTSNSVATSGGVFDANFTSTNCPTINSPASMACEC